MSKIDERVYERLANLELGTGDLIATRSGTDRDYTEFKDDPVRFAHEILRFHPWEKQVEMARSVIEHKQTAVRGCHGAGKDAALAWLMLWAAYSREMVVLAISATERQLTGQLWAEMSRMWDSAGLPGDLRVGWLAINGERRINGMTSGNTSNLSGWHNTRGTGVFVCISESQAEQVGNAAFDAAHGNTAGPGSRIVVVGNPIAPSGRFFEVHRRRDTWHQVHISAFDHPNIKEGRIVIPGGPDPSWPAEMKQEHGESSSFYVSRVLAEFPMDSEDAAIPSEAITAAFQRYTDGEVNADGEPYILGIDPAGPGEDRFGVAIWRGAVVDAFHTWRRLEAPESAESIVAICHDLHSGPMARFGGSRVRGIYVDEIGIGHGLLGILKRKFGGFEWQGTAVEGVNVSKRPGNTERFVRRKDELVWALREDLVEGRIAICPNSKLEEELRELRVHQTADGKIEAEAKDNMRKRLGRSPDLLDALLIGMSPRVSDGRRELVFGGEGRGWVGGRKVEAKRDSHTHWKYAGGPSTSVSVGKYW